VTDWTTYDEIRYSNHPYLQTHPDRLAVMAVLHGLEPPRPTAARVLELGCGAGANLIGVAYAARDVRAVGVDLAATAIEEARSVAAEVGVGNVEFHHANVMDVADGRLGEFDYVIAHGLYAWIPPEARAAVLSAIKAHLAPNGIGYVSYNAHPGGHLRRLLREAGLVHAHGFTDDVERAEKARELYRFLELRVADDPYGGMLGLEVSALANGPQHRLVHDELSPHWAPVWFADFARDAASHGLAYLCEASADELWPPTFPEGIEEKMRELAGGDRIVFEQLTDLLLFRRFRSTLLCHEGSGATEALDPPSVRRLLFTARPPADEDPVGLRRSAQTFLATQRPRPVPFEELRAALGEDLDPDTLTDALLEGLRAFDIGPRVDPPARVVLAGERPLASALARWQIERQPEVTTLLHGVVRIEDEAGAALLRLLDGTRDRDAIRRDLVAAGGPELTPEQLEQNLRPLGELGLLLA
jgi:SAM-dependent methyltransferase